MTFDPTSVEVTCVTLPKDHCVQVPWKYIKVCGYSEPFCLNLNQRSLTPRWPLTPHLLRSQVSLYPEGSLCPSPMGIHQCMWIQWSILQNLPHTYTYIHIHTTYRISDHIVSFWTTFRRDKKTLISNLTLKIESPVFKNCVSLQCFHKRY